MEIDRRDLLTGLATTAAAAASLPPFAADTALADSPRPVLKIPAKPVRPPRPSGLSFLGPVVSDASFGDGISGFEALRPFLRGGSWSVFIGRDGECVEGVRHRRSGLTFAALGALPVYLPVHPEDPRFAVQAVFLDDEHAVPHEEVLLFFTHAARFAAVHGCRICREQGRADDFTLVDDFDIAYPATGGMDDAVVS
jgi:hypothetical protein